MVLGEGSRHSGEVIEAIETFTDNGVLVLGEFAIVALLKLVFGFVVKAGERHIFDTVLNDAVEGKLVGGDAGIFTDVVEKEGGSKFIGNVGVVDGDGLADH